MTEGKGGCGGELDRERGDFSLPAVRGRERGAPLKKDDRRDVLKFFHLFKKRGCNSN